jgi:hypothetical protein
MTKSMEGRFDSLDALRASELRGEVDRRLHDRSERAIPAQPAPRGIRPQDGWM